MSTSDGEIKDELGRGVGVVQGRGAEKAAGLLESRSRRRNLRVGNSRSLTKCDETIVLLEVTLSSGVHVQLSVY